MVSTSKFGSSLDKSGNTQDRTKGINVEREIASLEKTIKESLVNKSTNPKRPTKRPGHLKDFHCFLLRKSKKKNLLVSLKL